MDIHDAKNVPAEIKRIRTALGLTQSALSDLLANGGNTVSCYERGTIKPPKPFLMIMSLLDKVPAMIHLLHDLNINPQTQALSKRFPRHE